MSADTLSDLLRAVRLRGAFFFYVQGADPWVVETSQASEIIPVIMPGVEHMMEFHGIARGSCWAAIVGQEPIKLDQGDVILFPQGDAHVMSSAPGMRARVMDAGVHVMPKPPQLPYSLNVSEGATAATVEGGGHQTTVVCGFLGCDARPFNPLLASMPRVLRMPGLAAERSSWIPNFLHTTGPDRVAGGHARRGGGAGAGAHARAARRAVDPGAVGRGRGAVALGVPRALRPLHRPAADAVPDPVANAARRRLAP